MKIGYHHSWSKKYAKMVLFGLKTYFKKFFLGYFHPPTLPTQKNWGKMVPKQVFTRAGIKSPPPPTWCPLEAPSCRVKTTVSTTSVTLMSSSNWFDFFPSYLHLCWALKYVSQGMGSKKWFFHLEDCQLCMVTFHFLLFANIKVKKIEKVLFFSWKSTSFY